MKKLSLNLDDLQVESFSTVGGGRRGQGTVQGHATEPTDNVNTPCCWTGTDTTGGASDMVNGCSVFYTCGEAGCGGGDENSGWNTCGNGDECTLGYTEWNTCTHDYKHCGL